MKTRWLVLLLISLVLSVSPLTTQAKSNSHKTHKKVHSHNKDNEIVAYLIVINKNEIAAAKVAEQKHLEGNVKDYAELMVKDHNKNLNQTMKIAKNLHVKPAETAAVKDVKAEAEEQLSNLKPLNGREFENAYIKAMVKGHVEALDLIDNQLLANVNNKKLKQHLKDTRKHVDEHLQKAKQIQSEINE